MGDIFAQSPGSSYGLEVMEAIGEAKKSAESGLVLGEPVGASGEYISVHGLTIKPGSQAHTELSMLSEPVLAKYKYVIGKLAELAMLGKMDDVKTYLDGMEAEGYDLAPFKLAVSMNVPLPGSAPVPTLSSAPASSAPPVASTVPTPPAGPKSALRPAAPPAGSMKTPRRPLLRQVPRE